MENTKLEKEQLEKYRKVYNKSNVGHQHLSKKDYFAQLVQIRENIVSKYANDGRGLDLCCGNGEYMVEVADCFSEIIGLDFSPELLEGATELIDKHDLKNASVIEGNAKKMSFSNDFFDMIFCFSSLYYIPNVQDVINECARIIKKNGICVFDFGIIHSLNTIVCKNYPEWATPVHITRKEMYAMLKKSGLEIVEERAFQALPYWGERPKRLKWLLSPKVKKFMQKRIFGKMLDEWICKLPIIGHFAFRRIVVCKKVC